MESERSEEGLRPMPSYEHEYIAQRRQGTIKRALRLGVCHDGPSFIAWARQLPGCGDAERGWIPTPHQFAQVHLALDEVAGSKQTLLEYAQLQLGLEDPPRA